MRITIEIQREAPLDKVETLFLINTTEDSTGCAWLTANKFTPCDGKDYWIREGPCKITFRNKTLGTETFSGQSCKSRLRAKIIYGVNTDDVTCESA